MEPIGHLIRRKLNEQGRSVKEFAEAIGFRRTNVYRIFNQQSIDTELLLAISVYLRYDFFSIYAKRYQQAAEHCLKDETRLTNET